MKTITHSAYKGIRTRMQDFGIIILPDDEIYKRLKGYLRIADYNSLTQKSDTLIISGYPGDKPYGSQWSESTGNYGEKDGMITYGIFTHTGLSGAPVLVKATDGEYRAVGVHNTGNLKGTNGCNAATKIDTAVAQMIEKWLTDNSIPLP